MEKNWSCSPKHEGRGAETFLLSNFSFSLPSNSVAFRELAPPYEHSTPKNFPHIFKLPHQVHRCIKKHTILTLRKNEMPSRIASMSLVMTHFSSQPTFRIIKLWKNPFLFSLFIVYLALLITQYFFTLATFLRASAIGAWFWILPCWKFWFVWSTLQFDFCSNFRFGRPWQLSGYITSLHNSYTTLLQHCVVNILVDCFTQAFWLCLLPSSAIFIRLILQYCVTKKKAFFSRQISKTPLYLPSYFLHDQLRFEDRLIAQVLQPCLRKY